MPLGGIAGAGAGLFTGGAATKPIGKAVTGIISASTRKNPQLATPPKPPPHAATAGNNTSRFINDRYASGGVSGAAQPGGGGYDSHSPTQLNIDGTGAILVGGLIFLGFMMLRRT